MNRLASSTSPYLQQHAHNPVDWFPWGEEAIDKARKENKPILVSIGYSSCHWCHVMERESFLDEKVAAFMNTHFVNIKVDREERPDVDQVYMDAVQILTGRGGWPLNCFLLPDLRPFFGGTYFPPMPRHGLPSWTQLLQRIHQAFATDLHQVTRHADQLTHAIRSQKDLLLKKTSGSSDVSIGKEAMAEWYARLEEQFDPLFGGFGQAPKFPMITSQQLLLRIYYHTGRKEALEQVQLTLRAMLRGGIYDLVGGGLSRYATDREWKVPHFEKMLYDNAQLLELLSAVYQLDHYEGWIYFMQDIFAFLRQEMQDPAGGFYSALDADSEGREGKYYTWSWQELNEILSKEEWEWFEHHFVILPEGNWEETNILYLRDGINLDILWKEDSPWLSVRQKLQAARVSRIRPQLDDKVSTHWNGLLLKALYQAGFVLADQNMLSAADRALYFFLDRFEGSGDLAHSYAQGQWQREVFLDDYAGILGALTARIQLPGGKIFIPAVRTMVHQALEHFYDDISQEWNTTQASSCELPVAARPLYDYVYPSAASSMVSSLLRLANVLDEPDWLEVANGTIAKLEPLIQRYTSGFTSAAISLAETWFGIQQLGIIGPHSLKYLADVRAVYWPEVVFMAADHPVQELPLLRHQAKETDRTYYFLCEQYACLQPVENVKDLQALRQNVYF